MGVFALGGALGALLAYFFDPQNGKRRRRLTVDRTAGFLRSGRRQALRVALGWAGRSLALAADDGPRAKPTLPTLAFMARPRAGSEGR